MQAIRVAAPGGPEAMAMETLETPTLGPGEVLVRVEFAGVNFIDVYQRSGLYPQATPIALGLEGAGVVQGGALSTGTRVAWAAVPGSYATDLVAPAERLVEIPQGVDTRTAAAAMLQGMTAHYLAHSTYPLKAGESCLVHAAAGGVGLLLCQMAHKAGARVIGTVSTPAKAERARGAGADDVILYAHTDFEEKTRELTAGEGVDVVYDSVGQATFAKSLRCLRRRGMLVLFGQSSGRVEPFDPQLLNRYGSLYLTRPTLADYTASREELLARTGDLFGWIASGELTVAIHETFPLAEAAEAHRRLEGRQTAGKVLLRV